MNCILKVGEKQFSDVRKGCKSKESKIKVNYRQLQTGLIIILRSFKFTCKKCVMELNTAADASGTE